MIARPQLLFLDEPTTGLDPRSREQLWGTVRGLAAEGVTVLLTTQYLEEADQLADRIAMLDHGRIVARGTADQLKSSLGGEVVRLHFGDGDGYQRALGALTILRADQRLRTIEVGTDGSAASVHDLLGTLRTAGAPASRVSVGRPSLDDVFRSLTATASDDRQLRPSSQRHPGDDRALRAPLAPRPGGVLHGADAARRAHAAVRLRLRRRDQHRPAAATPTTWSPA